MAADWKIEFIAEPCGKYSSAEKEMPRNSFDTSQKTHRVLDAKRNGLMLFREIITAYSKNIIQHTLRTNCIRF